MRSVAIKVRAHNHARIVDRRGKRADSAGKLYETERVSRLLKAGSIRHADDVPAVIDSESGSVKEPGNGKLGRLPICVQREAKRAAIGIEQGADRGARIID